MASTAPPAKTEAAGAPPAVEAERANALERVATADLRAERQKRLPSPWTPDEPFSGNATTRDDARGTEALAVPSEERCTQLAARVLRATAELCGTPLSVTIAALVYLVVFYERPENTHARDSPQDVVPACLLLASKIEEKPTRVSDVVNAMQRVLYPLKRDPLFLRTERARLAHASRDAAKFLANDDAARENETETKQTNASASLAFVPAGIGAPAEPASPESTDVFPTASLRRERAPKTEARGGDDDANAADAPSATAPQSDAPPAEPHETSAAPPKEPPSTDSEALRSAYLRVEIAMLKKKHPGLMPKSLYASALSHWRDAPENPESDAAKLSATKTSAAEEKSKLAADGSVVKETTAVKETIGAEASSGAPVSSLETSEISKDTKKRTRENEKKVLPSLDDSDDQNFFNSRPVIGDAYYETKAKVLRAEQKVLKSIDAEVNVVHVVSVLVNVCRAVNAPKDVTQLALVSLTDALFATTHTRLALGLFFGAEEEKNDKDGFSYTPARTPLELAGDASAAAVSVAARLCGYALLRDEGGEARWTRLEEVKREDTKETRYPTYTVKRARLSDETRLDVFRGDSLNCLPAPWWVEMEFDHARVERFEKEMLRVLVRGAERSGAFLLER